MIRTILAVALLLALGPAMAAPREGKTPAGNRAAARRAAAAAGLPRIELVLTSAGAGERTVLATDLAFVYFRQTVYRKPARRSEEPTRQRIEVQDRRRECRCLRFGDWSKIKMKALRQVEVAYPPGSDAARVRLTERDGSVREVSAAELYGGAGRLPPMFVATVEGTVREFPLAIARDPPGRWPEETLVRILFVRR